MQFQVNAAGKRTEELAVLGNGREAIAEEPVPAAETKREVEEIQNLRRSRDREYDG